MDEKEVMLLLYVNNKVRRTELRPLTIKSGNSYGGLCNLW